MEAWIRIFFIKNVYITQLIIGIMYAHDCSVVFILQAYLIELTCLS